MIRAPACLPISLAVNLRAASCQVDSDLTDRSDGSPEASFIWPVINT